MIQRVNKKNLFLILLAGLFFLLFAVFTLVVKADLLNSFDFDTTHRLQNNTPLHLDPFFSFLSVVGRFEFTLTLLVIILLLRRKIWGVIVFGFFGLAHVVELIGKTIMDHPGPPHMFLRSHYSDFPGLHVHTDASYPSGHSMRSVFLGVLLISFIWKTKRLNVPLKIFLMAGITILVGIMLYSRVSLGEHWTTDVVGGTLLGIAIAMVSIAIL